MIWSDLVGMVSSRVAVTGCGTVVRDVDGDFVANFELHVIKHCLMLFSQSGFRAPFFELIFAVSGSRCNIFVLAHSLLVSVAVCACSNAAQRDS